MKILARFIDGKLAGYQFCKQEKVDKTTDVYPFFTDDDSNEVAWAKRWATHGVDQVPIQNRTVEVIDINEWRPDSYEKYEPPKQPTLEERVKILEEKVK